MSKRITLISSAVVLVLIGLMLGLKLQSQVDGQPAKRKLSYDENVQKFESAMRHVSEYYFEKPNETKMVEDAIKGMLEGLDPHSFYIPPKNMKSVEAEMSGSFEGIGIEFNILEDTLMVVSPIAGGPSERVGLQPGDRIVEVEGENIAGTGLTNQDVIDMLRGKKGTKVDVKVYRRGIGELIPFTITRDKIPINSVDFSYMIDDATGYLKVNRFAETTMQEFAQHLLQLKQKGMENLVLDLRYNPGGYLHMAQMMADQFLEAGQMIVYTEGRKEDSEHEFVATSRNSLFNDGGLVILINQGSASASEIVSGAVQDHDRGLIVGQRSFGKGLVQKQFRLLDNSAIRVVTSRYFTPSGRSIQKPFHKSSKEYAAEIAERWKNGEMFDPDKIDFPDSLKYRTDHGRIVYGGGGIMPDFYIPADTSGTSEYLTQLNVKNVFRSFSFHFAEEHGHLKDEYDGGLDYAHNFELEKTHLKEFRTYAEEKGVPFDAGGFETSKRRIQNYIKAFVGRALFNDEGYYPTLHTFDPVMQKAREVMPKAVELENTGRLSSQ